MRSSVFAHWIRGHRFQAYVVIPALMSLILMAMYFSQSASLQNLVAPHLDRVHMYSRREFGALEMLQNFVLLCVIFYTVRGAVAADSALPRVIMGLLTASILFLLLEEIDYGRHFVEFFTGQQGSLAPQTWDRNVHNRVVPGTGAQFGEYMKLASTVGILLLFVLAPLLLYDSRNRTIRLFVPNRWIIVTVVLTIALSRLAHTLDDAGLGSIDAVPGALDGNVSEFRELNLYYLLLLYTAILHERLLARRSAPGSRRW